MEKTITFQCHHCHGTFPKQVKIIDKPSPNIVYEFTQCPHCEIDCKLELHEHEVLSTNVTRSGESQQQNTDLSHLDGRVFSTKPIS
ncbi:hypothetical protein [Candidatus Albibeggiatoa sp. nov. NOAA]|uniref:hypothetical protein n=1 Tax=Candidatus Albibeggiatoa sp. nov. NOAA TaxID=3162724 RepID=UPI0032F7CD72|nr:hypothetical protein [Thiotrichaceae bacterium]